MAERILLTIAGFDPSSGAGATADLAVFAAHGFFGTSCLTALTVQSTLGVFGTQLVPGALVSKTLARLQEDLPAAGIKIGMLGGVEAVEAVCEFLCGCAGVPVVLDPVMSSSSGRELLDAAGLVALREKLLPLVGWVTPNREELAMLAGGDVRTLVERYPGVNVVVTGGDSAGDACDDLVVEDGVARWLRGKRIESRATHGTGCAFSSALLCGLVAGVEDAPGAAKRYVEEAIRSAKVVGGGKGPMRLLWPLGGK